MSSLYHVQTVTEQLGLLVAFVASKSIGPKETKKCYVLFDQYAGYSHSTGPSLVVDQV